MELFRRFAGKTSYDGEVGIIHASTTGLNMDVRFGYLLPKHGAMVYATAGCARVLGRVAFSGGALRQKNPEGSFGSFYPTFGAGVEYKLDHRWNIRADWRISITSKDDNKYIQANGATGKYEAKPSRTAFRISVTRNI
jgi:opacity protein-like surface antigen